MRARPGARDFRDYARQSQSAAAPAGTCARAGAGTLILAFLAVPSLLVIALEDEEAARARRPSPLRRAASPSSSPASTSREPRRHVPRACARRDGGRRVGHAGRRQRRRATRRGDAPPQAALDVNAGLAKERQVRSTHARTAALHGVR
ncbi:MAG: hypothetical protein AVDCRST_MAG67-1243 [uncultured Solirubrobacteraceae bacterium]|uniref:Uncharacterized protein n=1 Tax=uncultured Solirubrobacteraceae bacterium TaxID=1162706 RepID=A0A6J4S8Z8_9ACTN|nr:MAG: hypothetical protein AVDCRST_MAG67-1243 [uncultured Solirubrobacteraceae bacterium]